MTDAFGNHMVGECTIWASPSSVNHWKSGFPEGTWFVRNYETEMTEAWVAPSELEAWQAFARKHLGAGEL